MKRYSSKKLSTQIASTLLAMSFVYSGGMFVASKAQAATITVATTSEYDALTSGTEKDTNGNVVPVGSYTDNTVTIGTVGGTTEPSIGSGGSKNVYGSYTDGNEEVSNNRVLVHSGKMGYVYGGYSYSGAVTGNIVIISGGTISNPVCSGYSSTGAVKGNIVTINGGTVGVNVVGGYGDSGTVTGNSVAIKGGSIGKMVCGGYSSTGAVTGNSVTISGVEIGGEVYGGYSYSGDVKGNSVTISGGTVDSIVYGGKSTYGDATGNKVTISDGTINSPVVGGYGNSGDAVAGNSVIIEGGTINGINNNVYGGLSDSGSVTDNSVTIKDGTIGDIVYGGRSYSGAVTGNTVAISGGTVVGSVCGGVCTNGTVTDNSVTIKDGTVGFNVLGGYSYYTGAVTDNTGVVKGNSVTIKGGQVNNNVYGGCSNDSGSVIGNTVAISGGMVGSNVYGGNSENTGDVTGNSVTISGGQVNGNVYGGYSYKGEVTGNSVTISGTPTFGTNTVLYGGYSAGGGTVSGNTLNIQTSGLTVKNVANFETYNFYLQNDMANGDVLLTLTDDTGTNISGSDVNVGMAGSANVLQVGDSVTLMKNENTITANNVTYGKITQGVSLIYDFTTALSEDGKELVTTISEAATVSTDTKSPVETQVAAAAFLNSGADLLASSGIANAVAVTGGSTAAVFGAMGGGSMHYKSGSYADVHGYNLAMGVGKVVANKAGKLTFGPFVEYGHGNYTSHLDNGVRGDGNTKYYGIGMLARQDNTSGVYYEGSLRYGRMDADYASDDMAGSGGKVYASYDSSSSYYGAHLGIGKVSKVNDTTKADVYAKLLYNHQSGDSVALQGEGLGEVYDFDSVGSTRIRIGGRVSKDYSMRGTGYAGLAYEHEFDSEARATVKGLSTPAPSIKGSSGMLELGYILQPKGANDMSIDIGLQGWAGKKQGVSGSINFVWTF